MIEQSTFSSFNAVLRQAKIDENIADWQTAEGLCRSMDDIVSTDPCLECQLEEAMDTSSSSRSVSSLSSMYWNKNMKGTPKTMVIKHIALICQRY